LEKVTKEITVIGVGFGQVIAAILSFDLNASLLLMIVHGILGWLYVLYYAARYIFFP